MDYYSVVKRNEQMLYITTWVNLKHILLIKKKSHTHKRAS